MKTKNRRAKNGRKNGTPTSDAVSATRTKLVDERDQLLLENRRLRDEITLLRENLHMVMDQDYSKHYDLRKFLAIAQPCSIDKVIAELRTKG